jgi:hypothetical protein
MAEADSSNSLTDIPQNVLAELRALRDQVQTQHGLITALTGRLGGGPGKRDPRAPIRELRDGLPLHPIRTQGEPPRSFAGEDNSRPPLRPGPAGKAWWPLPETALEPLHPVPGWALYGQSGTVKTVGFSVIGLDEAATREAVDFVARAQRNQRNFVPVFLTDLDELRVFRDQGFVAEYVAGSSIEPPAARQRYLTARKELIQRKWNLGAILDMTRSSRPDLSAADFGVIQEAVPATALPPTSVADADPEDDVAPPMAVRTP